jgi:hypothetical protein
VVGLFDFVPIDLHGLCEMCRCADVLKQYFIIDSTVSLIYGRLPGFRFEDSLTLIKK